MQEETIGRFSFEIIPISSYLKIKGIRKSCYKITEELVRDRSRNNWLINKNKKVLLIDFKEN